MTNTPKVMMDGNGNNLAVLPLEQLLRGKTVPKSDTPQPQVQSAVNSKPVLSENNHVSAAPQQTERKGRLQ